MDAVAAQGGNAPENVFGHGLVKIIFAAMGPTIVQTMAAVGDTVIIGDHPA
jgi:hypothetical protein